MIGADSHLPSNPGRPGGRRPCRPPTSVHALIACQDVRGPLKGRGEMRQKGSFSEHPRHADEKCLKTRVQNPCGGSGRAHPMFRCRVAIIGYVRVSLDEQRPDLKINALKDAGAATIYVDHTTGATGEPS